MIARAEELASRVRGHLARREYEAALPIFVSLHPADQAVLLVEADQEHRQGLLAFLGTEESAGILEQMEPEEAVGVFGRLEAPALAGILDTASPDVAADVLKQLPEERSQRTLEGMGEREEVAPLLAYPDESAGGVMTPEFLSVRDDMSAANGLDSLRIRDRTRKA